MSLRAIPSFSLGYLMLRQGIYASLRVSVFGVRCGPAGGAVDSRWFCVRPVPSELWRGGCRGLVCCVAARCLGGEMFAVVLCAPRA